MKMVVKSSGGVRIPFWLPTVLLLNEATACLLASQARKYGATVNNRDMIKAISALRRYKRRNGGLRLMEVVSANGDKVTVDV